MKKHEEKIKDPQSIVVEDRPDDKAAQPIMTASEERKRIITNVPAFVTMICLLVATIVIFVLTDWIFASDSVFLRGISKFAFVNTMLSWVPSLLRTVQIVAISWVFLWVLRVILNKTLARTNRGITIVKLTNNFLKYLTAIIALFLVLSAWGVNTTTLLASAGILSLIIGLGAQSLISDILAGVFIVFEDEFRVGDIVIIDGWRGTVDEIGIRATKIIDWQGNIKIVNNSEIATIINQSKELSVTTCYVSIGYEESIPRVELIIKNNIERIRNAIPQIVDGPYYKGVDKLNSSSVDLLLVATVKESDYFIAQRALNREIKLVFDENGVTIPFPQVTVSYAKERGEGVSAIEAQQADAFVTEQREASRELEDNN